MNPKSYQEWRCAGVVATLVMAGCAPRPQALADPELLAGRDSLGGMEGGNLEAGEAG